MKRLSLDREIAVLVGRWSYQTTRSPSSQCPGSNLTVVRTAGGVVSDAGLKYRVTIKPNKMPKATRAAPAAVSHPRGSGRARGSKVDVSAADSPISTRASAMSCNRRLGSFRRHCRNSDLIIAGVSAGSRVQSGSVFNIEATVSVIASPWNAFLPAVGARHGAPQSMPSNSRPAASQARRSGSVSRVTEARGGGGRAGRSRSLR